MTNESTPPAFQCPTSGQLLGSIVSAFNLHRPEVGGPTAEFIGSGNAGKRSRDYFGGKWVPEATRHDICSRVVRSIVHAKLLPPLRLPAAPSGEVPETEQTLHIALFTWLQIWDGAFVVPAKRWPNADSRLAGFVLGRQAVIDLALRWAAVCLLAEIDDPECIWFDDGRTGKAKGILDAAMRRAGKQYTRDQLARAIRSERPGLVNDRTVDRWFDEIVVPEDANLVALSSALCSSPGDAEAMLRFLRLQYGFLTLAKVVRGALDSRLCDILSDGLFKFAKASIEFHRQVRSSSQGDAEQEHLFQVAAWKLLVMGAGDPVAAGWINAFLSVDRTPIWHDDLRYAGNGAVDQRIGACLKVVGDWPRMTQRVSEYFASHPEATTPSRELLEIAAIMSMNDNRIPPDVADWVAKNPDKVVKIASTDQMKAATRAEQATSAMHAGDHEGSLPHWARAVSLETDARRKANYLFIYGCCLWQARSRRFDDAIEALNESSRLWPKDDPQYDRPFVEIAIIYQNRGWFDHALQHLDQDPANFAAKSGHFNFVKGKSLHALHRWADAIDCFEKAIELRADSTPDAHAFGADSAFQLHQETKDKAAAQRGRDWAKKALHLGRPWAHDKWDVG